jgi:hypothetical protein
VGEAGVGPREQPPAPRDGDADVDRSERVGQSRLPAAAQIDRRGHEQDKVDERSRGEEGQAHSGTPEDVASHEAREEHRPEGDLGGDDEDEDHVTPLP